MGQSHWKTKAAQQINIAHLAKFEKNPSKMKLCRKMCTQVQVSNNTRLDVSIFQHHWGYSSVVEHSTADREVHGSTPCAPYTCSFPRFLN